MSDTQEVAASQDVPSQTGPRLLSTPATRAGWWSFALAALAVVLFIVAALVHSPSMQTALWGRLSFVNQAMLVITPGALVAALVGGVLAISALVKKREQSVLVWFAAGVLALAVVVIALSFV